MPVQAVIGKHGTSGHACVLQAWDSVCPFVAEQAAPPFAAGVVMVKVRACVPLPQGFEHVLHAPHEPTQSVLGVAAQL